MKKLLTMIVSAVLALPLAAQSHDADGKVVLNKKTTVRIAHAYGYVHDTTDDEAKITVVFTDKPLPEAWDVHQFESTAPAGVIALVLRMDGSSAERATLYHPSGTFVVKAPKMSMEWSEMGETVAGRIYLPDTTLEDGASTLGWNIKFDLEME